MLDTNVLIYAADRKSPFHRWAREIISRAVATDGAAIDAVALAELCVGDATPHTVADRVRRWGVNILDVPAAAAEVCASAYRRFRERRLAESGKSLPEAPLPDFFIGAHAAIMGWELATADKGRFSSYFPTVTLKVPQ
ncbi:MAG: PIN domain-containing protein [Candidatus Hydrogenedentes bacterium]|nr:PIN domain-containing protein [Candidatus Hydrogenedentota bacterium]